MSPRNEKPPKNKVDRKIEPAVTASPIVSPNETGLREGAMGVPGVEETAKTVPGKNKRRKDEEVDFGCPPR